MGFPSFVSSRLSKKFMILLKLRLGQIFLCEAHLIAAKATLVQDRCNKIAGKWNFLSRMSFVYISSRVIF